MKKILTSIFSFTFLTLVLVACGDDKKDSAEDLDYSELQSLVAESNALLDAATTVYYTQESIDTFSDAITVAEEYLEEANAKYQSSITTQINTLKKAKETFENSALNLINLDKNLILAMNFDKDTIQDIVNTSGLNKDITKLAVGPKEIFGTAAKPSYESFNGGKALLMKDGGHVELMPEFADDFLQTSMSFATWVRIDEENADNYIASFNYWHNWQLKVDKKGEVLFTFVTSADGGASTDKIEAGSVATIKKGIWAHVVVSLDLKSDDHKLTFYIDGKKTKEYTVADIPALAGTVAGVYTSNKALPLMIGAATTYEEATAVIGGSYTAGTWPCLRGAIDNFAIYKTALSYLQVEKLYADQK